MDEKEALRQKILNQEEDQSADLPNYGSDFEQEDNDIAELEFDQIKLRKAKPKKNSSQQK